MIYHLKMRLLIYKDYYDRSGKSQATRKYEAENFEAKI
jgi:hypothetical protein